MKTSFVFTRTPAFNYGLSAVLHGKNEQSSGSQSTMYIAGEYFVSASNFAAQSGVDYFCSPVEQIRDKLNEWFSKIGSCTQVQCSEDVLTIAPSSRISAEFFDSYEPFFKTVQLYRAQAGTFKEDDLVAPSDEQMSAAVLGLANLMAALIPAPSPMLLDEGTIGGYWRRGSCYVSIDFEVDGEHTWVGTNGVEFHSGVWQLPGGPIPRELASELLSITA